MMTIYPFNFDSTEIMTFRDKQNNVKHLVGKEEDYSSEEQFYNYLVENNIQCNLEQIEEKYIRYYPSFVIFKDGYYPILPKRAEEAYRIAEGEGYTFCKPTRGAFRVYVLEIR